MLPLDKFCLDAYLTFSFLTSGYFDDIYYFIHVEVFIQDKYKFKTFLVDQFLQF